jgi:hypothetical protein
MFTKSQRRNFRRGIKRCAQRRQDYYFMLQDLVSKKAEAHYYWARRENKYLKSTTFQEKEQLHCKYHNQIHRLCVEYFVFPMDVDLLSFFEDGVRIGYTML